LTADLIEDRRMFGNVGICMGSNVEAAIVGESIAAGVVHPGESE
jgi:hypothetical protein